MTDIININSNNLIEKITTSLQCSLYKNLSSVYIMKINCQNNDKNLFIVNNKQEAKFCIKQFVTYLLKNLNTTDFDLFVDYNYTNISFTLYKNIDILTPNTTTDSVFITYNIYYEKIDTYMTNKSFYYTIQYNKNE